MDDRDLLASYDHADRPAPAGRPWVMANMVAGVDGSTAVDGRVGRLTSPVDQALFHHLRGLADLVLVGARTVRAERYGPVRTSSTDRAGRRERGQGDAPRVAVVSRSLAFDWSLPLFAPADGADEGPRPLLVTTAASARDAPREARARAELVVAGEARVDLAAALGHLHGDGCRLVLTEGGPTLLGELAAAGLLDELCLTLAPVLGGDPLPTVVWPPGAPPGPDLHLAAVRERHGHVFLRYLVAP